MRVNIKRKQKYNAKKTQYRGWNFDSRAEAQYAEYLDGGVESGEIHCWLRQTPFDLGEDTRYRSDFVVIETDGTIYAVDVKGMETPRFRQIRKLWEKYGRMPLRVIKKGKVSYEL